MDNDTITRAAEEVTFHSEASNYRIVQDRMRRRQIGESGEVEVVGGKTIQFYDGVYTTSDPEEIKYLRESDSNGRFFWELNSEADRPTDASGLIKEIIKKGSKGDYGRVAEILVAERTATSHPDVLAACTAVLEAAEEELPARPQTPLHEIQRVRVGPTAPPTPGVPPDLQPGEAVIDPSSQTPPPGAPAAPAEGETSVPVAQVPAAEVTGTGAAEGGVTPEAASTTFPNAQGPLVGGEQPPEGSEATVTSALPPVGGEAETSPGEGEASAEGAPDDHPPTGDGGAPGAPAAPPEGESQG